MDCGVGGGFSMLASFLRRMRLMQQFVTFLLHRGTSGNRARWLFVRTPDDLGLYYCETLLLLELEKGEGKGRRRRRAKKGEGDNSKRRRVSQS
jgi:hypothetical protein